VLDSTASGSVEQALRSKLTAAASDGAALERTVQAARWLGLLSPTEQVGVSSVAPRNSKGQVSVLDVFCELLERKLAYAGEERDVVLLHHTFGVRWADGKRETRTSSLISYGGEGGKLGRVGGDSPPLCSVFLLQ
jgi:hypothetical protein